MGPRQGDEKNQRRCRTAFKGSGFYITDYRSEGYKQAAKKDSAPPSPKRRSRSPRRRNPPPKRTKNETAMLVTSLPRCIGFYGSAVERFTFRRVFCRPDFPAVAARNFPAGQASHAQRFRPVHRHRHRRRFPGWRLPRSRPTPIWSGSNPRCWPCPPSASRIAFGPEFEIKPGTPWRGRIYLAMHPAQSLDETVNIISQRFSTKAASTAWNCPTFCRAAASRGR